MARALFHVSAALVSLLFAMVLCTPAQLPWAAFAFAGTFWLLEGLRRLHPPANDVLMKFFRHVARPVERHKVNSATWFATALVLLASTGSTLLSVVGVAVLGVGDPAAAIVGRRFGRVKVANNRTLEGSLTFVVLGGAAAFGAMMLLPSPPAIGLALVVAATAATAGAVAELFARRVDDNFLIPLVSAAAASAVLLGAGLS